MQRAQTFSSCMRNVFNILRQSVRFEGEEMRQ